MYQRLYPAKTGLLNTLQGRPSGSKSKKEREKDQKNANDANNAGTLNSTKDLHRQNPSTKNSSMKQLLARKYGYDQFGKKIKG